MKALFFGLLSLSMAASVQAATFKWSGEMCEYRGEYDARKVSARQLKDSTDLINGFVQTYESTPYDSTKVHAAYTRVLKRLTNLQLLPNSPNLAELHKQSLKQAQFFYDLSLVEAQAVERNDAKILLSFKPAAHACKKEWAAANAPGGLRSKDFDYGWHNCANSFQPSVDQEKLIPAADKELRRVLRNIKEVCGEP